MLRLVHLCGVRGGASVWLVSIPDRVTGVFHPFNSSGCTMTLGVNFDSNIKEYQGYLLGVKAAGAWCLRTLLVFYKSFER